MASRPPETGHPESPLVQRAVALARQGDPEALDFLYVRYASDVLRCVAGFFNEDHKVEEITEGVFANLATAFNEHEQGDAPFAAWVLEVAREAALERRRGRGEEPGR